MANPHLNETFTSQLQRICQPVSSPGAHREDVVSRPSVEIKDPRNLKAFELFSVTEGENTHFLLTLLPARQDEVFDEKQESHEIVHIDAIKIFSVHEGIAYIEPYPSLRFLKKEPRFGRVFESMKGNQLIDLFALRIVEDIPRGGVARTLDDLDIAGHFSVRQSFSSLFWTADEGFTRFIGFDEQDECVYVNYQAHEVDPSSLQNMIKGVSPEYWYELLLSLNYVNRLANKPGDFVKIHGMAGAERIEKVKEFILTTLDVLMKLQFRQE